MNRILLMVMRNVTKVPGLYAKLCHYAKNTDKYSRQETWDHIRKILTIGVNSGNIDLKIYGQENIPEKDGCIFYGNHQGLFDCVALVAACEKPLSAHADTVIELQKLEEERGLIFLEAIMFMHLPQRKLLEEALQKIGGVNMAKLDFCQRSSKLDAYLAGELPNIFNPKLETGALMDLGVYCIYPALHLFGKPDKMTAAAHMLESGADSGGSVGMVYSDKLVNIAYSKIGQAAANTDFQGNLGTLYVESISKLENMEIIYRDGTREFVFGAEPKHKLMGYEAKDFYRYITEPEASAKEYAYCKKLAVDVSVCMETLRNMAGIRFPSDEK